MSFGVKNCKFCGHSAALMCDGKMPDGTTCDNDLCRACAGHPLALICGRGKSNTRDICPDCTREGRGI